MSHHDDMTKGDTLILWNDHRVTCAGKPYTDNSEFAPRLMVRVCFQMSFGQMEMAINVQSIVRNEGKPLVDLPLFKP